MCFPRSTGSLAERKGFITLAPGVAEELGHDLIVGDALVDRVEHSQHLIDQRVLFGMIPLKMEKRSFSTIFV
jgi:hypothetical protein